MRFVIVFLACAVAIFGLEIVHSSVANGKTTLVFFDLKEDVDELKIGKKTYKVFFTPDKQKQYALIPVSYYHKPAAIKVGFRDAFFYLDIVDGGYAKEKIHVQKSKVNPKSEAVKKRTSKEYAQAMKIYNTITPTNYVSKPFIIPLESKITSDFGKARVYNDTLKGYHSGTDFRAKVGTPIVASNAGTR